MQKLHVSTFSYTMWKFSQLYNKLSFAIHFLRSFSFNKSASRKAKKTFADRKKIFFLFIISSLKKTGKNYLAVVYNLHNFIFSLSLYLNPLVVTCSPSYGSLMLHWEILKFWKFWVFNFRLPTKRLLLASWTWVQLERESSRISGEKWRAKLRILCGLMLSLRNVQNRNFLTTFSTLLLDRVRLLGELCYVYFVLLA